MPMKLLNVGGADNRSLPPRYHGPDWHVTVLDINPAAMPDLLMDAREIVNLDPNQYDAVLMQHFLEHVHEHEIPLVLMGARHVLKPGGWLDVRAPDLGAMFRVMFARALDLDSVIYEAPAGAVRPIDMLYGLQSAIPRNPHMAHHFGFSVGSLGRILTHARFENILVESAHLELTATAHKP